ncbi:MAG TPA: bifunctional ADP-dependent NAD(P)H-hydrate dehydratase/NAD(P)H-hydrate epimerase [Flavobacteriales bacterium]|nr:bifunctional ADP-dependent NAD(P)H-hydrate dehydratase/NAD(P)H-hydrate epimerase [Flavobacteriales bacterium]|tara:strand:- start:12879 stop:14393 length:1515 start_codon:yes stop_codon:yes gene_type:complete
MKILTAKQIREADKFTIENEPIASIDIMERAAGQCVNWIVNHFSPDYSFALFCGVGNNGGDGLAIARMLTQKGYAVKVYVVEFSKRYSQDFSINLDRLKQTKVEIDYLTEREFTFSVKKHSVIIDAIFGTGLSRPAEGFVKEIIKQINALDNIVVSIDIPSGMFAEDNSDNDKNAIIRADEILTFEFAKLAFLLPENAEFVHHFIILPIGIHPEFVKSVDTPYILTDEEIVRSVYRIRNKFSHKGTFGHSLLMVTQKGMAGAGILTSKACLRAGSGLVTAYVPECNRTVFQNQIPEIIVQSDSDNNEYLTSLPKNTATFNALGIGCGIGQNKQTQNLLKLLIQEYKQPMVIDADAINILAENKTWLSFLPPNCIFTPHPKELERLIGKWNNDLEKLDKAKAFAFRYSSYVVVKGAYSVIVCPDGKMYFNPTGNAGMATAGSGDVLTGIITALLAQKYPSKDAAVLGVYLHGLAGDLALEEQSMESLIASDIIEYLGKAFKQVAG